MQNRRKRLEYERKCEGSTSNESRMLETIFFSKNREIMIIFEWHTNTPRLLWFSSIIYEKIRQNWYFPFADHWMRCVTLKLLKMWREIFTEIAKYVVLDWKERVTDTNANQLFCQRAKYTATNGVSHTPSAIVNRMLRYVFVCFEWRNTSHFCFASFFEFIPVFHLTVVLVAILQQIKEHREKPSKKKTVLIVWTKRLARTKNRRCLGRNLKSVWRTWGLSFTIWQKIYFSSRLTIDCSCNDAIARYFRLICSNKVYENTNNI